MSIIFSGRVKPSVRGADGHMVHALWARVDDKAVVKVASTQYDQEVDPVDDEREEALEAALLELLRQARVMAAHIAQCSDVLPDDIGEIVESLKSTE